MVSETNASLDMVVDLPQKTRENQKNNVEICTAVSSWSIPTPTICENVDIHRLNSHIIPNARPLRSLAPRSES